MRQLARAVRLQRAQLRSFAALLAPPNDGRLPGAYYALTAGAPNKPISPNHRSYRIYGGCSRVRTYDPLIKSQFSTPFTTSALSVRAS